MADPCHGPVDQHRSARRHEHVERVEVPVGDAAPARRFRWPPAARHLGEVRPVPVPAIHHWASRKPTAVVGCRPAESAQLGVDLGGVEGVERGGEPGEHRRQLDGDLTLPHDADATAEPGEHRTAIGAVHHQHRPTEGEVSSATKPHGRRGSPSRGATPEDGLPAHHRRVRDDPGHGVVPLGAGGASASSNRTIRHRTPCRGCGAYGWCPDGRSAPDGGRAAPLPSPVPPRSRSSPPPYGSGGRPSDGGDHRRSSIAPGAPRRTDRNRQRAGPAVPWCSAWDSPLLGGNLSTPDAGDEQAW